MTEATRGDGAVRRGRGSPAGNRRAGPGTAGPGAPSGVAHGGGARALGGTLLAGVLVVLLAGCGAASGGGAPGGPGLPLQPDAGTTSPQGSSAEATVRPPEPTLDPSTLRGLWAAGDEDGAQILYEFDADGTFTRISLLSQERSGGTFRFQDVVEGTFRLDGDALALRPTAGAQTVDDPDSPDGDGPVSTARTDLERETHRARLREGGDVLVLEPRDGAAVSLVRQEG